jgi:hypothetical protein
METFRIEIFQAPSMVAGDIAGWCNVQGKVLIDAMTRNIIT